MPYWDGIFAPESGPLGRLIAAVKRALGLEQKPADDPEDGA